MDFVVSINRYNLKLNSVLRILHGIKKNQSLSSIPIAQNFLLIIAITTVEIQALITNDYSKKVNA